MKTLFKVCAEDDNSDNSLCHMEHLSSFNGHLSPQSFFLQNRTHRNSKPNLNYDSEMTGASTMKILGGARICNDGSAEGQRHKDRTR